MPKTLRWVILLIAVSTGIAACTTGEKVRGSVTEGMSKNQVISLLGNPDGFKRTGDFEALLYVNRLITGWSWDRTDYSVILESGRVVEYGRGEVRQNTPSTLILIPISQ